MRKCCVVGCRTNLKSELKKDPSNINNCFTFASKETDPKCRAAWIKNVRKKENCSSQKKQQFRSFILILNLLESLHGQKKRHWRKMASPIFFRRISTLASYIHDIHNKLINILVSYLPFSKHLFKCSLVWL